MADGGPRDQLVRRGGLYAERSELEAVGYRECPGRDTYCQKGTRMPLSTVRRITRMARHVPTWLGYRGYYRFLYDSGSPLARRLDDRFGFSRTSSRQTWDAQYARGAWDCLGELTEQAHTAVLAGYITSLKPSGAILDVGCGEGHLLRLLRRPPEARYVGLDISDVAITRASAAHGNPCTTFVTADASTWHPDDRFDVIVWNESLYYFAEQTRLLRRFATCLAPNGLFITSLFRGTKADAVLRRLKQQYALVDETRVSNRRGIWTCSVFAAGRPDEARDDFRSQECQRG